MRFLLDENVHRKLAAFLIAHGHDATRTPKGLTNGAVFALARSESRILITHDEDFAQHPPEVAYAGVVLIKILPKRFEQLKQAVNRFLLQAYTAEQLRDTLILLFEDRSEAVPFRAQRFSV